MSCAISLAEERKEGRREGREEGLKEGLKEVKAEGRREERLAILRRLVFMSGMPTDEALRVHTAWCPVRNPKHPHIGTLERFRRKCGKSFYHIRNFVKNIKEARIISALPS